MAEEKHHHLFHHRKEEESSGEVNYKKPIISPLTSSQRNI